MKKILAAILMAAMMITALVGCGGNANEETNLLEEIKASGELIVVCDPAWAPFEYIGADGEIAGCDIEIAEYIAEQLGVELVLVNAAFDTLINYIDNGEAHLILSAMTITEERAESVAFSDPYTIASQYIIVPEDNTTVETVEDLAGMAIGVHLGTTGDFLVSDEVNLDTGVLYNTGATVQQYKFLTDACLAMGNGDLDAIVCDTLLAENLCATNEGLKCFQLVYADGSMTIEELGIAMPLDEEELLAEINNIIAPIIEDGTVDGWIVEHTDLASALN